MCVCVFMQAEQTLRPTKSTEWLLRKERYVGVEGVGTSVRGEQV